MSHFEDVFCFIIGKDDRGRGPLPDDGRCLFCISTERPELTLSSVVRGMIGNKECQNHAQTRRRYANKVFSVLRQVAKALQRLHKQGLVHGNLCLESFGKYDESWKLADVLGAQTIEDVFEVTRLSSAAPPESVLPSQHRENNHSRFRSDLVALPSIDSWGFGKLAYEVLVGDVLIEFDVTNRIHSDDVGLDFLSRWSEKNLQDVRLQLKHAGLSGTEISLITHCLRPEAKDRLDLDGILLHSAWTELRQQK